MVQRNIIKSADGKEPWRVVVFAAECDPETGECPVCGEDFGECPCPGPTQEDEFEYRMLGDLLYARRRVAS